jgi:hypothetical protein
MPRPYGGQRTDDRRQTTDDETPVGAGFKPAPSSDVCRGEACLAPTEDGGRRTEDRGQRTEDRRHVRCFFVFCRASTALSRPMKLGARRHSAHPVKSLTLPGVLRPASSWLATDPTWPLAASRQMAVPATIFFPSSATTISECTPKPECQSWPYRAIPPPEGGRRETVG